MGRVPGLPDRLRHLGEEPPAARQPTGPGTGRAVRATIEPTRSAPGPSSAAAPSLDPPFSALNFRLAPVAMRGDAIWKAAQGRQFEVAGYRFDGTLLYVGKGLARSTAPPANRH